MGNQGKPFFRLAMDLSLQHREHFAALDTPGPLDETLIEEAQRSLDQQRDIEASDSISFDEYLRRYFAQSLDEREQLLG